jgi:hypothetical protein
VFCATELIIGARSAAIAKLANRAMKLYLVRHAQSMANVNGLVTGTVDDPLSSQGGRQPRLLRHLLRREAWLEAMENVGGAWDLQKRLRNPARVDVQGK